MNETLTVVTLGNGSRPIEKKKTFLKVSILYAARKLE